MTPLTPEVLRAHPLPEHEGSLRLLHIHRNVPGVLSKINEIFSRHALNIDGQFLRTDPKVGYVVIDVAAGVSIAAIITHASSASLGLSVGARATAIFKASSVIVGAPA